MARLGRYYINVGGTVGDVGAIKFAFRAPLYAYDNIGDAMGVKKTADNNTGGLVYGARSPRPPKVRIQYTKSAEKDGSAVRFCEADKLNAVLLGGLNAFKIKVRTTEFDINSVNLISG